MAVLETVDCHPVDKPLTGDWSQVQRLSGKLPHHEDFSERLVLSIVHLFQRMQSLESLYPNPVNAAIFNQLFDLVTTSKTTVEQEQRVLSDNRIRTIISELRKLWGEGEYLLELEFARKVISGDSREKSQQLFESFPYLDQYYQLARMEANTLDTALGELQQPPPRKIAFLGSGPMPFTALCIRRQLAAKNPALTMLNVDRSAEAIHHSRLVARCLDIPAASMAFLQEDVASPVAAAALRDCDVVHFAALIGTSEEEKRALMVRVAQAMRPGALIMLRSTDSLRQCLYPRMDLDSEEVLRVVTPVVATRYYGQSTSLTTIVVKVD